MLNLVFFFSVFFFCFYFIKCWFDEKKQENQTDLKVAKQALIYIFQKLNLHIRMTNQQHSFNQSRIVLSDSQINSLAGATSGIFVSILVSPLDVVKTRIQVNPLPKGASSTPFYTVMYRLAQQEGFKALYKGLGTTMMVWSSIFSHSSLISIKFY